VQLNNLTQRVNAVILRIQRDKASMAAIADVNGVDRRRTVGDRLPDANARSCWQVPCASAMARASKPG
jgi:hypothetical protein